MPLFTFVVIPKQAVKGAVPLLLDSREFPSADNAAGWSQLYQRMMSRAAFVDVPDVEIWESGKYLGTVTEKGFDVNTKSLLAALVAAFVAGESPIRPAGGQPVDTLKVQSTAVKPCGQIRPGDVIWTLGKPRTIIRVEPGAMPKTMCVYWIGEEGWVDGFCHHVDTPMQVLNVGPVKLQTAPAPVDPTPEPEEGKPDWVLTAPTKRADQIRPGDVIWFKGRVVWVTSVRSSPSSSIVEIGFENVKDTGTVHTNRDTAFVVKP